MSNKIYYRVYGLNGDDTSDHYLFEDALKYANELLDIERDNSCIDGDGWSEDTRHICIEKHEVIYEATEVDKIDKPETLDEDDCDENGVCWSSDYDCMCDYKMMPVVNKEKGE